MQLSTVRDVYAHDGPFATMYLEARPPAEDAPKQLRLRWGDLREQLETAGAEAEPLDAIEARLSDAQPGEGQVDGRVLVADQAGVALERDWDASLGAGDAAHWTVLPELGAYVREAARTVRALVVVADQQGALLRQELLTPERHARELASQEAEGDSVVKGVHKPRGGALSHKGMQRRADEAAFRNAGEVVEAARKAVAVFQPHVVVLAGEVQGRTAVREQLTDELARLVVESERGGGDRHAVEEGLAEDLTRIAADEHDRQVRRYAETFGDGLSAGLATQGNESLAEAAELGAVETLLFEDGVAAAREAFLIKTCAETDARAELLAGGTGLTDGVGALLRFPLPD
jgi:hypothetical protein